MSDALWAAAIGGTVGVVGSTAGAYLNHYLQQRRDDRVALRDRHVEKRERLLGDFVAIVYAATSLKDSIQARQFMLAGETEEGRESGIASDRPSRSGPS
jgi:hypothetical protein